MALTSYTVPPGDWKWILQERLRQRLPATAVLPSYPHSIQPGLRQFAVEYSVSRAMEVAWKTPLSEHVIDHFCDSLVREARENGTTFDLSAIHLYAVDNPMQDTTIYRAEILGRPGSPHWPLRHYIDEALAGT